MKSQSLTKIQPPRQLIQRGEPTPKHTRAIVPLIPRRVSYLEDLLGDG